MLNIFKKVETVIETIESRLNNSILMSVFGKTMVDDTLNHMKAANVELDKVVEDAQAIIAQHQAIIDKAFSQKNLNLNTIAQLVTIVGQEVVNQTAAPVTPVADPIITSEPMNDTTPTTPVV